MLDDLAAWGAPQDVIEAKIAAKEQDESFLVWRENWSVLGAFLTCTTQWRVVDGMNGRAVIGFDYAGVEVGLKRAKIKLDADQWADLQVMERAALSALNTRD